jgi:hypothetical protein
VIDGANGICGLTPSAASQATTLGATLAFAAMWTFAPVRWRRPALIAGCVLALPGAAALGWRRGDAPSKVAVSSGQITKLERAVRRHAQAHGCAVVERNDCEACQPILRLALAHAGACASGATILVGEGALGGECAARGLQLVCGGAP